MRWLAWIGVGALGLVALAACSGGDLGNNCAGGTGGVATSEGPGSGGAGGRLDSDLPDCVQALVAPCPTSGTCVVEQTTAGRAYTWRDGAGQIVATGTNTPGQITCASSGQSSTCNIPSTSVGTYCQLNALGNVIGDLGLSCSPGTCP